MGEMTVELWETHVALREPVGRCPIDAGPMIPEEPVESMGRVFLDATCSRCGHQTTRPGGRSLPPRNVIPFRRRHVEPMERPRDHAERAAGN